MLLLAACGAPAGAPEPQTGAVEEAAVRALELAAAHPAELLSAADDTFVVRDVILDDDGTQHVRLDRLHRGLRVIGGDLVLHADPGGRLAAVTLAQTLVIAVPELPSILASDALVRAGGIFETVPTALPRVELAVHVAPGGAPISLAYEVVLEGERAGGMPTELHVVIDALSGAIIDSWDGIQSEEAEGNGFFSGRVELEARERDDRWLLEDEERGGHRVIDMGNRADGGKLVESNQDEFGDGSLGDDESVAVDAHYGAAQTWDYFRERHRRRGVNGQGKSPYSRVHYKQGLANAVFSGSCGCLSFGDGNGATYPWVSLDIVAHEWSHALTAHTAGLRYSGESGGLNEATSDIFATMVEFHAGNPKDPGDYLIGERLYRERGSALRVMAHPERDGRSVGCWSPQIRELGVHYSSGVANHFFYLLAEGTGSETHTCNTGARFSGIGREDAARIWYRALTVYMTSTTDYRGARKATLEAADDLFGDDSDERKVVAQAWEAVKVR
jgi:Zn-dependent metalloprotease